MERGNEVGEKKGNYAIKKFQLSNLIERYLDEI